MGVAETLAADPDFAKLHQADPALSEKLMTEALHKDIAAKGAPLPSMAGRTPLEGNTVDDRSNGTTGNPGPSLGEAALATGKQAGAMTLQGGGAALGTALAGPLGGAVGGEMGNVASKALGLQPGDWKRPDMSDALALGTPLIAPLVLQPARALKNAFAPLARSSQMGQEAANSVVQMQNAKLQADYELSVASQAKAKAVAGADYESQIASWNTLKAAQTEAKRQAAEDLRGFATTMKSRNVTEAATWAANRPGVPTAHDVSQAYTAADTLAQAHAVPINLPEVTAVKKTILAHADTIAKQPGGGPKAQALRDLATSGQESGITLTEANEIIKGLHQDIAALRRQPSRYAQTEANAYSKIVDAYETGMTQLEQSGTIPSAVRDTVKAANTLYLKQRTDQELTEFLTRDAVTPGPSGQPQLDPRAALKALDTKANERMVGYMQKVMPPDGNGKNLYDMTKETLTQMASTGQAEWEAQRLLTKTGGMALPDKPLNPVASPHYLPSGVSPGPSQQPLPYPAPRPGMAAVLGEAGMYAAGAGTGAMLGGGPMNPLGAGMGGIVGLGVPKVFATLMQTGWGQRTLLALVNHQGRTISPALVGLATAAVRAGEGQDTQTGR